MWKKFARLAAAFSLVVCAGSLQSAEIQTHQLKVLGTWNNLSQFRNYEQPFWIKTLPDSTQGKISGQIISISVMGLKGYETLNLLRNGVFDMGNMVVAYVTGAAPEMEGIDLAGVATDMETSRKYADTYRNIINEKLGKQNLIMLAHYPFGRQFIFCKEPFQGLAGLKGRKIRTSSATHADFITGIGATNVTIPFGEVIPAIQNGVVDCAVTGALSAYYAKWQEVIRYVSEIPLNMGMAGLYANKSRWLSIDTPSRSALKKLIAEWENQVWTDYVQEESEGLSCLTGDKAGCSKQVSANMTPIGIAEADKQSIEKALQSHVFPGWLKRCGKADCKALWNSSIGKVSGIQIQ